MYILMFIFAVAAIIALFAGLRAATRATPRQEAEALERAEADISEIEKHQ